LAAVNPSVSSALTTRLVSGLVKALEKIKKRSLKLRFLICLVVAGVMLSPPLNAWEYNLAPQIHYLDYLEVDEQGNTLNTETGWLKGADSSVSGLLGHWTIQSHLQFLQGTVDYQGQTQSGQPHHTRTKQIYFQYGISAGYTFRVYNLELTPTIALDKHYWRRDIQAKGLVSQLTEDYQWWLVKPSLKASITSAGLKGTSIQVGTTNTHQASMRVHATKCTSAVTVYPKADNGWFSRFEIPAIQHTSYKAVAFIEYQQWNMKRSDSKLANSCIGPLSWSEPTNKTQLWSAGIKFLF